MTHSPIPAEPTGPTVSVVIPIHNEARIIERCLDALVSQTAPADEIIVVDNGCSDGSAEIARRFPGVRVVTEPRRGVTFARTTGFDAARSDVIARIDADTVVPPDWVARIRTDFRDPSLDGQGGSAAIAELSPGHRLWFGWWYRGFRVWHERSIGVSPMLYGFNSALRRDAWQKARHLIELGDAQVSEDVDVTIALLRTGHRLRYAPTLVVQARLFRSIDRKKLSRYYETDSMTLARHRYGNRTRWSGRIT
ncbi:glycosyltransferase [Leucobacter komagatae]|uniref:glycosyltransferase n=1 Tax=Leucobacter komagatae TaxID=55969 RepID=UPI0014768159|nr:glycosyltransferase family A protein [Leucobacter komagatae]